MGDTSEVAGRTQQDVIQSSEENAPVATEGEIENGDATLLADEEDDGESPPLVFGESTKVVEGITKQIIKEGQGPTPEKHATCFVHYRGWLAETNEKFQDTWQEKDPLELILGHEKPVLRGLGFAVGSMRGGESALFRVGWELGYGREGNFSFPHVPPKAELIYQVQLIGFENAKEGIPRAHMTAEERMQAADRRRVDGNEFFKKEQYPEAVQQYEMALGYLNEDFMMQMFGKYRDMANAVRTPTLLNLAACMLKVEKYNDVIEHCNAVLMEEENNAKALFRRGKARLELGQTATAQEDLERANKLLPGDKAIAKELKVIAAQEREIQQKQKELYKGMFGSSGGGGTGAQKNSNDEEEQIQRPWYLRLWAFLLSFLLFFWPYKTKRRVKVD